MTITIADGRGALWQWDTGRRVKITDGDGVKQIHYQNRALGGSVDVDVGTDGTAVIPDELLQDWHPLTAYAYVTDDTGGYTKVQVDFAVHKRARPSDYVYTPTEHAGFDRLRAEIGDLSALQTTSKDNLVSAINEAAASGGSADAILYTPQILTDDQKKTARANVEALSDNNVYYTYIPNNHSNDIYKLALSGPIGFIRGTGAAGMTPPITVIFGAVERGLVEAFAIGSNGNMCTTTLNLSSMPEPVWTKIKQLRLNDDDTLSQQTMASDPTSDMQIATKKYVDDHAAGGGGNFAWEKIADINVADDVQKGGKRMGVYRLARIRCHHVL